jgi:hypothetical protein
MAGKRGNTGWIMFGRQSAKGTPATLSLIAEEEKQPVIRSPFAGGSIDPSREFGELAETDSNRDKGQSYVKTGGVAGSPEIYVRDASIGALLYFTLGTDTVSGTAGKRVHTVTPANNIPYVTFWDNVADTLFERHVDCFIDSLNIKATAGSPLTATAAIKGLTTTRSETDFNATAKVPLQAGYVYNYNDATVELSGGATALIGSFEIVIENSVTAQQTDDVQPIDVVAGKRAVSLTFDIIFETLAEYNKFHYGEAAGTTISNALYTTSANFSFSHGADNGVSFALPSIAYETFPITPDPGGAPIVSSVRAVAQRPAEGSNVLTSVVKNQVEKY